MCITEGQCVVYDRVFGPFFFTENTVRPGPYLDMLELYAVPQIQDAGLFATAVSNRMEPTSFWHESCALFLNQTFGDNFFVPLENINWNLSSQYTIQKHMLCLFQTE
jgi:hypothetical protein